jgi:hypothetical protein
MPSLCRVAAAQKTATTNLPQNNVMNGYKGYYVNGVYVVPVTTKPSDTYLILGNDMPCNPYNNNSNITPSPYYPNCKDITTSIVKSNWTTTTTQAPVLLQSAAVRIGGPSTSAWSVVAVLLAVSLGTASNRLWWSTDRTDVRAL